MSQLGIIENGYVCVTDGQIAKIGEGRINGRNAIDANGCVLMPAFVDCHSHACWAGNRFDEFEMALAGASYLDILKAGGGVMSTVRAVRNASQSELEDGLSKRIARMTALGTGTIEVKSGYGLNTETELKMLNAIDSVRKASPQQVIPTFLGAHAIDPENPTCLEQIINETLPAAARKFPGIACDAYCEQGAWSLNEVRRLFEEAQLCGCPLRVHTDQFTSLGMTRLAIEMDARSVDHLEAITPEDVKHLAKSDTIGVLLPCSGFHVDDRYAPGRALIDGGAAIAIATNYNPGSAPSPSMPFAISLACRKLKLTPAEAITAATFNAACVLGVQDSVGSIEIGKRADLQILDISDERELAYEFAGVPPTHVFIKGRAQ